VFHIKNMGAGTWTGRLADLAIDLADGAASLEDISVSVDGPYGRTGHYFERSSVVLVAGGIGITPLASVLGDLYSRATDPDVNGDLASVRSVHLVWVARDRSLFTIYAPLLSRILKDNAGGVFKLHLFCSNSSRNSRSADGEDVETPYGVDARLLGGGGGVKKGGDDGHPGNDIDPSAVGWCDPTEASAILRSVRDGRPDLEAIFADALRGASEPLCESVSALVCGPGQLVQSVSDIAFEQGLDFHAEVFHW
jgi:hypothetical protein